ncbi:MAG: cytochrome b, partial [Pseudomonadota bacterium]
MANESARQSHAPTVKILHWITAAIVIATFPIGLTMGDLTSGPFQNQMYNLHRSLGVVVIGLTALRLASRLVFGAPLPVAGMPRWQDAASRATHIALYVLLFAVPLSGWLATNAFGAPISVFGLFTLPVLIGRDRELAGTLFEVHEILAFSMAALFALH